MQNKKCLSVALYVRLLILFLFQESVPQELKESLLTMIKSLVLTELVYLLH